MMMRKLIWYTEVCTNFHIIFFTFHSPTTFSWLEDFIRNKIYLLTVANISLFGLQVDKFHKDQQSLSLNNGTSASPMVAEVQPVSQWDIECDYTWRKCHSKASRKGAVISDCALIILLNTNKEVQATCQGHVCFVYFWVNDTTNEV